jgi:hypothetical protein
MWFSHEVRVMLDGPLLERALLERALLERALIERDVIERDVIDCSTLGSSPTHGSLDQHAAVAPAYADGTLVDRSLRLADDQEVVRQMAYVLRSWPRVRGRRGRDEALARVTAERLVDYLHLSGFELMKRPLATDSGYTGGGR